MAEILGRIMRILGVLMLRKSEVNKGVIKLWDFG